MRRADFLLAFSREHHTTLSLVRRLRAHPTGQALAGKLLQDYLDHRTDLLAHFAGEETQLRPRLLNHPDPSLQQRLLDEHASLRRLLAAPVACLPYRELADLLEQHIRFEERELFPALETNCSPPGSSA